MPMMHLLNVAMYGSGPGCLSNYPGSLTVGGIQALSNTCVLYPARYTNSQYHHVLQQTAAASERILSFDEQEEELDHPRVSVVEWEASGRAYR